MIVSDTNLIVYLHVESEFTDRARHVHALDPDWVFPPVTRSEATNVLVTLTREKWISAEAAAVTLSRLEPRIMVGFRDVSMKAALELAVERGVSAYDTPVARFLSVPCNSAGISGVSTPNVAAAWKGVGSGGRLARTKETAA